jgi:transposase
MRRRRYPSDLTDPQWTLLVPHIPPAKAGGRPRTTDIMQLNIKATQDTVDLFYRLTDSQGWSLGETLERALEALERELTAQK